MSWSRGWNLDPGLRRHWHLGGAGMVVHGDTGGGSGAGVVVHGDTGGGTGLAVHGDTGALSPARHHWQSVVMP